MSTKLPASIVDSASLGAVDGRVTCQQAVQAEIENRTSAVLNGIDEIDWKSKSHAYGPAIEVPTWIKALRYSDVASERSGAMDQLWHHIVHQGSRWEATAAAIPFLLKLVADPLTPNRDEILDLLVALAVGDPDDWQPQNIDVRAWRQYTESPEAGSDDNWDFLSYDAVRAGVPIIRDVLLNDMNPDVQARCAYLLAWFPEDALDQQFGTLHTLWRVIEKKGHYMHVTTSTILAIGLLTAGLVSLHRPSTDAESTYDLSETLSRLSRLEMDERRHIKWAASKVLLDLDSPTTNAIATLANVAADTLTDHSDDRIVPCGDDIVGWSKMTLLNFAGRKACDTSIETIGTVLGAFTTTTGDAAYEIGSMAMNIVFGPAESPPRPEKPLFQDLNEPQKLTIHALAETSEASWTNAGLERLFRTRGFVTERDLCRQWAGIEDSC